MLATHSPINRNQLWVHDRQLPKGDYTIGLEVRGPDTLSASLDQSPGPFARHTTKAWYQLGCTFETAYGR